MTTSRDVDTDTQAAALAYVERGWAAMPMEARGKRPVVAWQELQSRLPTVAEVKGWFARPRAVNVGIVTGAVSNLVVVDVDPRHGGAASLAALEREHGPLPVTVEAGAVRQAHIHRRIGLEEQHPAIGHDVEIDAVEIERDPAADLVQGRHGRPPEGFLRCCDHPLGMGGDAFNAYQFVIGVGAWLGTVMLFNVWVFIWPNQKKILGIVPATDEQKTSARKTALYASRINYVLSIPMLMCMAGAMHGLPF